MRGLDTRRLCEMLESFKKTGVVVIKGFDLASEGSCVILEENKASLHKTFRDLFNDTTLQRAKKRTSEGVEEEEQSNYDNENQRHSSPVKCRRSSSARFKPRR